MNFPIFGTLVTLGLASYGEFTLRRKLGLAFRLPGILPSRHKLKLEAKLAKDPPLRKRQIPDGQNPAENTEEEETISERKISSESDKQSISKEVEKDDGPQRDQSVEEVSKKSAMERFLVNTFSPIERVLVNTKNFLLSRGLEFCINFSFLVINYIHLIYLGYTFSHTDMSMKQTLEVYEDFKYISPILVSIVLFYAHLL